MGPSFHVQIAGSVVVVAVIVIMFLGLLVVGCWGRRVGRIFELNSRTLVRHCVLIGVILFLSLGFVETGPLLQKERTTDCERGQDTKKRETLRTQTNSCQ